MSEIYDVVIVGAGPSGSTTAYYLAKQGFNVLLVDKFNFPRDKTCGDGLTPRALHILDEMGILDTLHKVGYRSNTLELISPKGHTASALLPKRENLCDYLLIVPRLILDNIILKRALTSGANFQAPVRVTGIEQENNSMLVKGEQRAKAITFRARMVIHATGANTKLLLTTGLLKKMPQMVLAARTYYDGITSAVDAVQCRFDNVPLPGYGWIFPVSDTSVNVGIGLFNAGLASRWMPKTAHSAFDTFIQSPPLQKLLDGARQASPIKGFPIRVDFARSPTFGERTMIIGEAAGLVNPVTGEGIDYGMESGKMAAEHLTHMFAIGDFSLKQLAAFDKQLRQRYQRLFVLCDRLRLLYLNPFFVNQVVRAVARSEELMNLFMNIAIENQNIYRGLAPSTIAKVIIEGMPGR
ncbi:MAG TPA: geranylgeranyl reductase family protein [Ktedonobacteraceae bacterium]